MIKINNTFISSYLTPGISRDNFIFENCPKEFLSEAKQLLSSQDQQTKSCVIELTKSTETTITKALDLFESDFHKKLIARDYICSMILKELLIQTNTNPEAISGLKNGLKAISNQDREGIINFHSVSPMPHEITKFYREICPFELNFILNETKNIYIQQAINNFISAREPFSVKIFSTKTLPTYLDQNKTAIENPHDYMKRNVQDFIEQQYEKQ